MIFWEVRPGNHTGFGYYDNNSFGTNITDLVGTKPLGSFSSLSRHIYVETSADGGQVFEGFCNPVDVIQSAERIPATFWGVLAGSFFTLLGVWRTNVAHANRLRQQLEHDRELKRVERDLALRRDVYLPAAEAVSTGLSTLARGIDLSIPAERWMDDWAKRIPAIAKANLIANKETLESLTRFNAHLGSKAAVLNALRVRLVAKKQEAERLTDQASRFTADNGGLIAQLQQWNLAGTAIDPKRLEAWQQQFSFNKQHGDKARAEHARMIAEIGEEHIAFAAKIQEAIAELSALVTPMLKAARAELGLPFDADHYNKVIREAQEQSANDLAVVAAEVRSLIKHDQ